LQDLLESILGEDRAVDPAGAPPPQAPPGAESLPAAEDPAVDPAGAPPPQAPPGAESLPAAVDPDGDSSDSDTEDVPDLLECPSDDEFDRDFNRYLHVGGPILDSMYERQHFYGHDDALHINARAISRPSSPEITVLPNTNPPVLRRRFEVKKHVQIHVAGDGNCGPTSVQYMLRETLGIDVSIDELKEGLIDNVLQLLYKNEEAILMRKVTHSETVHGMKEVRIASLQDSPVSEIAEIACSENGMDRLIPRALLNMHFREGDYLRPRSFRAM